MGYNCRVDAQYFETNSPNTSIESHTGRHKPGMSDDRVERLFYIMNDKMNYIPVGYSKLFKKLNNLWIAICPIKKIFKSDFEPASDLRIIGIRSTDITELTEDIFENVEYVEELYLHSNKIDTIHENAFRTCKKLVKVHLYGNKLEYLANIFAHNPLMEEINLKDNKLKIIHNQFLVGLSNLHSVNLFNNLCINQGYPDTINSVHVLKTQTEKDCKNPLEKIYKELMDSKADFDEKIDDLNTQLEDKIKEIEDRNREAFQMGYDFEHFRMNLTSENERLVSENDGLRKEIEILSHNSTTKKEEIEGLIAEIEQLKFNISFTNAIKIENENLRNEMFAKLNDSEKKVNELKNDLNVLNKENLSLKKELLKTEKELNLTLIDHDLLEKEFNSIEANYSQLTLESMASRQVEDDSVIIYKYVALILAAVFIVLIAKLITDMTIKKKREQFEVNMNEMRRNEQAIYSSNSLSSEE
jgi:hypothetical protein